MIFILLILFFPKRDCTIPCIYRLKIILCFPNANPQPKGSFPAYRSPSFQFLRHTTEKFLTFLQCLFGSYGYHLACQTSSLEPTFLYYSSDLFAYLIVHVHIEFQQPQLLHQARCLIHRLTLFHFLHMFIRNYNLYKLNKYHVPSL
jgi:hypothetical protein